MSDEEKIENLVGDAMENYRMLPKQRAKDAIRRRLVKEKLLKGNDGKRLTIIMVCLLAVILSAVFYLSVDLTRDKAVELPVETSHPKPLAPSGGLPISDDKSNSRAKDNDSNNIRVAGTLFGNKTEENSLKAKMAYDINDFPSSKPQKENVSGNQSPVPQNLTTKKAEEHVVKTWVRST
jgi:hypothetical protein